MSQNIATKCEDWDGKDYSIEHMKFNHDEYRKFKIAKMKQLKEIEREKETVK